MEEDEIPTIPGDHRQWVCLKCGYVNDHSSVKCMSCRAPWDGTQPRTTGAGVMLATMPDGRTTLLPLRDYNGSWCNVKNKEGV